MKKHAIANSRAISGEKRRINRAALMELSLRNYLCLFALQTEHGTAFHVGTIVRTMFDSFFLFDAGFGEGDLATYTAVDLKLGEVVLSFFPGRPWRLSSDAVLSVARLLNLFDNPLQTAPVSEIVTAHRLAEANFQAPSDKRLSIAALVQSSKCNGAEVPSFAIA
ncbi:hypothetical protein [Paraburkholderia sp. MM6662-R1]|uniref:hypothetical protein n=1 Tax=Paraburkholderia sp. MM6662-R1 TaxID=2991066 RepID=UPI003D201F06